MNPHSDNELRIWKEAAQYRYKHRDLIRKMFQPVTAAMVEDAQIESTDFVLDVAAGAGDPSLTIAEEVVVSGRVCSTDPVADMVAAARLEARDRNINNVDYCQCLGDAIPFASHTFDATLCRFGIMFFPDPDAGVREMLRVIKPGSRAAFVVWSLHEANPFHSIVTKFLDRYDPQPPADPDAPGAYRFAAPGKLSGVVRTAGGQAVHERHVDFFIEAHVTFEGFWQLRSDLSDTLRQRMARLSPVQLSQLKNEVSDDAQQFFTGDQMRFPAQVLIVSAET